MAAREIERADIVVWLLSAHFFAASCWKREDVKLTRKLQQARAAWVIPVVARPCFLKPESFGGLTVLQPGGKAVTMWRNRDVAWSRIVSSLHDLLGQRERQSSSAA